jgi:hypothetical protein
MESTQSTFNFKEKEDLEKSGSSHFRTSDKYQTDTSSRQLNKEMNNTTSDFFDSKTTPGSRN